MFKKKSFLTLILAIFIVMPAMLIMTACGNNDDSLNKINGAKNVVAEGEFKKGTTLAVNELTSTDSSYAQALERVADQEYNEAKVAVYDISLANSAGAKIQPNGKVKITMPKPFETEIGYKTFHIKDEENVEVLKTNLVGTNIYFETTSFSYFIVVEKVVPNVTYLNTQAEDSLKHAYNGSAVFVSKKDISINGTPLNQITDENVLSKISYVWRDKTTKAPVTPDVDITITGEAYAYGINRDGTPSEETVGDAFAGPCVVGEYEFVLLYDDVEMFVENAKITESNFKKITSVDDFDATTAPTIFGEICYYTIVGYANGKKYVMQMPADGSTVAEQTSVEAKARLVSANDDNSISLGGKFDFVFTPMRYFENEWKYYPETSTEREDLLVDFCTGYYGARTGVIYTATPVVNRTGWTNLSGDKIVREKGTNISRLTYGNLAQFADDGAVTIYAPRKGQTANNALRLCKNANGEFVFTGKDKTTDTRESYPVYVYKQNVESSTDVNDKYSFNGKLSKQYDGTNVMFDVYKSIEIKVGKEDIGALIKAETVKFIFTDKDGKYVMDAIMEDIIVKGPKDVGKYKLVLQERNKDGKYSDIVLHEFEIYSAS